MKLDCYDKRSLFINDSERYFSLKQRFRFVLNYTIIVAGCVHFLLIFAFWYLKVYALFYYNVASVFIYILSFFLNKYNRSVLAGVTAILEVAVFASLTVVFFGWEPGFSYFVIQVVALLCFVPVWKRAAKVIAISILSLVFLGLFLYSCYFDPLTVLPVLYVRIFHGVNLAMVIFGTAVGSINYYSAAVNSEKFLTIQNKRNEELLLNILPYDISLRLKSGEEVIADTIDDVAVLFLDLVGFTEFSRDRDAVDVVTILNTIFSEFDTITDKFKIEKIKTMGDGYMAASGLNGEDVIEHHKSIVNAAFEMIDGLSVLNKTMGTKFSARIGINSGKITAGVIGKKKFIYDIWGDSVNTASRMESASFPGRITISDSTYQIVRECNYNFEKREPVEIKGKGVMTTYFIDK